MSAFDDELRRMREMEKLLEPYREALKSMFTVDNRLEEALEREGQLKAAFPDGSYAELLRAQALSTEHASILEQQRYGFLESSIDREVLRFSIDAREQHKEQVYELGVQVQTAFDAHVTQMMELLRQNDMLGQLRGRLLEPTTYKFELFDEDPPQSQIVVVQEITAELLQELKNEPKNVYRLTSRKFEYLVAELLQRSGYEVEVTSATRDGGKDVIAKLKTPALTFILYVECKHNHPDNKVGVQIARQLFGVVQADRVSAGLIVTTSSFTEPALKYQRQFPHLLDLKAYDALARWLCEIG